MLVSGVQQSDYLYIFIHIYWRRQWHPTLVLLPGKSHGWRSLVGCGPWGRKESDTTERLHFHFSLSCIGEGNGNPLQCSCLENPRDGGAWWTAIYGVAQSRTQLKWLSSSNTYIYIYIYFFFRIISIIDYYMILSIVPCAIQWVLSIYIFILLEVYIWSTFLEEESLGGRVNTCTGLLGIANIRSL